MKGPEHPAQTLSLTNVHSEKPPHVSLKLVRAILAAKV
ncbi:hypothetical protein SAMN05444287_2591 [Octadecabacter temperatus]|uniref:Uncharacterized protein n=1 Tax=Octadecabacter temperatus TaxID=1458307 RepID=A0A0K0YA37_9RHOB|nr:hypothetical protein OSB_32390 [Octadecabacter temperatus]SIO38977.1 hypothetical protein SAMN05444287_2591 [Octadecabacter temperatus]